MALTCPFVSRPQPSVTEMAWLLNHPVGPWRASRFDDCEGSWQFGPFRLHPRSEVSFSLANAGQ
jgi:hypothetical protein